MMSGGLAQVTDTGKLGTTNIIIIYVYLSICIIKVRYIDLKLQGLANLSDSRKDYKAVMM